MDLEILTLLGALDCWCDQDLVQRVRNEECRHTEYELDRFSRIQLTSRQVRRPPSKNGWMVGSDFTILDAAWLDLERDFRQRIERGLIHLRGVQLDPEMRTEPEVIPNVWAAKFLFDFGNGSIKAGNRRFAAIACSQRPWAQVPAPAPAVAAAEPAAPNFEALRPEDVPYFGDELIIALLEENGRRAVENGSQLISPGKVSLLAIIERKMERRAQQGESCTVWMHECEWLADWIKTVVTSHRGPSAKTINRKLLDKWRALRPPSKPAI